MNKPPRLDLNPSSAERWTTCTASPHFILANADKLPPENRKYADPGTTAHEVAAAYLLDRCVKIEDCPTEVDKEMRLHAWDYAEYVIALREKGSTMTVETKYPLWYMPERNALVDAAILNPGNAHIVDYKYGEGIIVSPVKNLQGAIYARSVLPRLPGFEKRVKDDFPISIHIYQPRGQSHHVWETTWGEIVEFTSDRVEKPSRVVLHNHSSKTVFAPSEKACQWCPAKGFCAARQEFLTKDLEAFSVVKDEPLPLATTLSEEQLTLVQTHGAQIKKWIDDVLEYNTERGNAGHVLPGFKMVMSRGGNRFWTDPQKAALVLFAQTILKREELIEEKVIGPAAVEKLLGKGKLPADVMDLIGKPPGSPVLAPIEDKREAIGNTATIFQNLEEPSSDTAE